MLPTADQVARVIVAAGREAEIDDPTAMLTATNVSGPLGRARMYAAIALRKLFPECPMPAIGRMVGSAHPPYVSIVYSKMAKGQFAWFDMAALQRVMAAGAPTLPAAPENARAATAGPPEAVPEPEERADLPNFIQERPDRTNSPDDYLPKRTYLHSDFVIPPSKKALRDDLRKALEATAKMPSQN